MSVAWMAKVWDSGPEDPTDRYVLLKLADNADQDGRCFPSLPEICEKTRLSVSTVRRSIAALESDGWITVIRGRGAGHRSQYQLHEKVSERKVSEKKVSERKVSERPKKGVTVTQKGVTVTEPPHSLKGVTVNNRQETPANAPRENLDEFVDSWNSLRGTLPAVSKLTEARRKKLYTRIREGLTLACFEELAKTCASTPFLRGESQRGWRADFDWLIASEANALKVQEGKYAPAVGQAKPQAAEAAKPAKYTDPRAMYNGPEYQRREAIA